MRRRRLFRTELDERLVDEVRDVVVPRSPRLVSVV